MGKDKGNELQGLRIPAKSAIEHKTEWIVRPAGVQQQRKQQQQQQLVNGEI